MPVNFSIYLDLLRVLVTFTIYVIHMPFFIDIGAYLSPYSLGQDAVILFFVLSGYVVSYAAEAIEKTPLNYFANRVARIFPVALTAICLALIVQHFGVFYRPELFDHPDQLQHIPSVFVMSALFLNQIWTNEFRPFDNLPYWTLSYEVWDYVFFGFLTFTRGRWRLICLAAVLALNGPKFILLLPAWLAGMAAFKLRNAVRLTVPQARFLCLLGPLMYLAVKSTDPINWSYTYFGQRIESVLQFGLGGAASFAWAYVIAVCFALHLFAAQQLPLRFLAYQPLARAARKLASYTFSFYIYHYPLYHFWEAVMRKDIAWTWHKLILNTVILTQVYLLANVTERPKKKIRQLILNGCNKVIAYGHGIKAGRSAPCLRPAPHSVASTSLNAVQLRQAAHLDAERSKEQSS